MAIGLVVGFPLALTSGQILRSQLCGWNPYEEMFVAQLTAVHGAIPSSIHFLNRAMRSAGQAPSQGMLPSTRVP